MHELQKLVMLATSCCMGKPHMGLGLAVQLWPLRAGGLAAEAILRHADQVMHPALLGLALPVLQTQDL